MILRSMTHFGVRCIPDVHFCHHICYGMRAPQLSITASTCLVATPMRPADWCPQAIPAFTYAQLRCIVVRSGNSGPALPYVQPFVVTSISNTWKTNDMH